MLLNISYKNSLENIKRNKDIMSANKETQSISIYKSNEMTNWANNSSNIEECKQSQENNFSQILSDWRRRSTNATKGISSESKEISAVDQSKYKQNKNIKYFNIIL